MEFTLGPYHIPRLSTWDSYQKLNDAFDIGNWDDDEVELNLPYIDDDKTTILQDAIISRVFHYILTLILCLLIPILLDLIKREKFQEGEKPVQILDEQRLMQLDEKDPVTYRDEWDCVLSHVSIEAEYG